MVARIGVEAGGLAGGGLVGARGAWRWLDWPVAGTVARVGVEAGGGVDEPMSGLPCPIASDLACLGVGVDVVAGVGVEARGWPVEVGRYLRQAAW